jgi:glycopeptide antibiotics resistance protein
MIRGSTKIQKSCWVIFVFYLIGIMYYTIFAESLGRGPSAGSEARYNLVFFNEIRRFWIYRNQLGIRAFMLNVAGNVLAFMPCGFLLPAISRRCRWIYGAVPVGLLISFLIECTQLIFRVGSFDVDDLFLNTIGVLAGFLLNRMIQRWRYKRAVASGRRRVRVREISAEDEKS